MPRYEFSEGSSNKFWEIKLSGTSFTTTYGKVGTSGQTTMKQFKSEAEAKKEHDKLVAEKVKKGYQPAGGGGRTAADDDDEADEDEDDDEVAKPAPKKVAVKKAAAPAAAAKPASSAGAKSSPRYFEFSEGTSNKFWEIRLDGTNVRTRYGKIGTSGQQTMKEFDSVEKATKEYDKLVAEKTKKGYEETAGGGGEAADDDEDDE
ncbi:MAG TPA: WGR domain-containing protein [Kofleriaceae bacterium]|nr:WGR domain-containing protein [Kofleriaceae bacterium]